MDFEWDETKNQSNISKHGISFEAATVVLLEPHAILYSTYAVETRFLAIGPLKNIMITVVYTERVNVKRIISVRRSRHEEKRAYRALYG